MKKILNAILIALTVVIISGCDRLVVVGPDSYERNNFERQVRNSVRKAVQSPGVANGSTLIVSAKGDTLVAPTDSLLLANPTRIVYVDIASPEYPKGVTRNTFEGMMVAIALVSVCALIIIVILGAMFIVNRRNSARNRIISQSLDSGVQLPESFYTGVPTAPEINVTQNITRAAAEPSAQAAATAAPAQEAPAATPGISEAEADAIASLNGILKTPMTKKTTSSLATNIMLVGIGIVIFYAFAVGDAPAVGIFIGGIMAIVGLSRLISLYIARRF